MPQSWCSCLYASLQFFGVLPLASHACLSDATCPFFMAPHFPGSSLCALARCGECTSRVPLYVYIGPARMRLYALYSVSTLLLVKQPPNTLCG